jgi:ferrochelatase
MTPTQFLRSFKSDARLVTGAFYPDQPLSVEEGDRVGVVMMWLGGPGRSDEVFPYLYRLFMDPVRMTVPFGRLLRPAVSRFWALRRWRAFASTLTQVGGGAAFNRLAWAQARALERTLAARLELPECASVRVYLSSRYARPHHREVLRQMEADGVTKRVILPLFPQYAKTATGSCLSHWWHNEHDLGIDVPTALVPSYCTNRNYLQALDDRVTEGLQRFPKALRSDVPLVFVARTTLASDHEEGCPYVEHLERTIQALLDLRGEDRPATLSFLSKMGPVEWLEPALPDALRTLAQQDQRHALIVPLSFTSDHVKIEHEVDVEAREGAARLGFEQFEVAAGLNSHPLFIAGLADEVSLRLRCPAPAHGTKRAPSAARVERVQASLTTQSRQPALAMEGRAPVFLGRIP